MKSLAAFIGFLSLSMTPVLSQGLNAVDVQKSAKFERPEQTSKPLTAEFVMADPRKSKELMILHDVNVEKQITKLSDSAQKLQAENRIDEAMSCYSQALQIIRENNTFRQERLVEIRASPLKIELPDSTSYDKIQRNLVKHYCQLLRKDNNFAQISVLEKEFGAP